MAEIEQVWGHYQYLSDRYVLFRQASNPKKPGLVVVSFPAGISSERCGGKEYPDFETAEKALREAITYDGLPGLEIHWIEDIEPVRKKW